MKCCVGIYLVLPIFGNVTMNQFKIDLYDYVAHFQIYLYQYAFYFIIFTNTKNAFCDL